MSFNKFLIKHKFKKLIPIIIIPILLILLFQTKVIPNDYRQKYKFLFVVISEPNNVQKRDAIRETWGNATILEKMNSKIVFFVGQSREDKTMLEVENEEKLNKDIVISKNFIEDYQNLTLKVENALTWALNDFESFDYFIKIDDDVLVNVENFFLFLSESMPKKFDRQTPFIFCSINSNLSPIRDPEIKWFVSEDVYPNSTYPDYCAGFTYLISKPAIHYILNNCQNQIELNFDDVYFTGLCRVENNIPLVVHPKIEHSQDSDICEFKDYATRINHSEESLKDLAEKFKNCK